MGKSVAFVLCGVALACGNHGRGLGTDSAAGGRALDAGESTSAGGSSATSAGGSRAATTAGVSTGGNDAGVVAPSACSALLAETAESSGRSDGGGVFGDHFVTRWSTTESDLSITLPLAHGGLYDFSVAWGDATCDHITSASDAAITHSYAAAGSYLVTISGTIQGWAFVNDCVLQCPRYDRCRLDCKSNEVAKLDEILHWGTLILGKRPGHFLNCGTLTISATDTPKLPYPSSLHETFRGCTPIVTGTPLNDWDTSGVTDMAGLFSLTNFTADLPSWDTSNVTDMSGMFFSSRFAGDISSWDTSQVTSMSDMFSSCLFNGDISGWDTSSVTSMSSMFNNTVFDGDISGWDVSHVVNMHYMFARSPFHADISGWDTSRVTDMSGMFLENGKFDANISGWHTSSATDMAYMFDASSFSGDISGWDISSVTDMKMMFSSGNLTTEHYDRMLVTWAAQETQPNVAFSAGSTRYTQNAATARASLVARGWVMTDGGVR